MKNRNLAVDLVEGRRSVIGRFIVSGMVANIIDPASPDSSYLEYRINSTVDRLAKRGRSHYVKDENVSLKLKDLLATLSPEAVTKLKTGLLAYAKTLVPSYDDAAKNIMRAVPDGTESVFGVNYTCDGKTYDSLSGREEPMYQGSDNPLSTERQEAREICRKAVDKLVAGLSGKELYDTLVSEVLSADVVATKSKYLGRRTSGVSSGSFHTRNDYEYEVKFRTKTITVQHTSSSYFSGGWN